MLSLASLFYLRALRDPHRATSRWAACSRSRVLVRQFGVIPAWLFWGPPSSHDAAPRVRSNQRYRGIWGAVAVRDTRLPALAAHARRLDGARRAVRFESLVGESLLRRVYVCMILSLIGFMLLPLTCARLCRVPRRPGMAEVVQGLFGLVFVALAAACFFRVLHNPLPQPATSCAPWDWVP